MTKTPILQDARFWTAFVDAVVTIIFILLGRFDPAEVDFYKSIWIAIQPVIGLLIVAFTASEAMQIKAEYEKYKSAKSLEEMTLIYNKETKS